VRAFSARDVVMVAQICAAHFGANVGIQKQLKTEEENLR